MAGSAKETACERSAAPAAGSLIHGVTAARRNPLERRVRLALTVL